MATKAALISEINTNYPDNTSALITPAILRTTTTDGVNSWQQAPAVNVQAGTTYTVVAADYGQMVALSNAASIAVTLPTASTLNPFNVLIKNFGAGLATVTPATGTIDGGANVQLSTGQSIWAISDGVNWRTGFSIVGGTLSVAQGGTGQSSYTKGDILAASAPTVLSKVAIGTNGQALIADSTQTAGVRWGSPSLVVGTTAVGGGTSGRVLFDNAGTLGELANTGTGNNVLANSPSLITPNIDSATAASINNVIITTPATTATLTIANTKSLTVNNSMTLAGTDGSTLNIGGGGTLGTVAFQSVVSSGQGGTGFTSYVKGDLLAGTTPGQLFKVTVGSDGQVLTADSTQTTGVKWAAAGVAVGSPITGGGAGRILYDNGGALAEDANLTWDSANIRLMYRASQVVFWGNPATNNMFGASAGNLTATGSDNLGFGRSALSSVTGGNLNNAFGSGALQNLTGGTANVAMGWNTGALLIDGTYNVAIGYAALGSGLHSQRHTAVGVAALNQVTGAAQYDNTAIGYGAIGNAVASDSVTAIGAYAHGGSTGSLVRGVAVGVQAGYSATTDNTLIGYFAGHDITSGSFNTIIGTNSPGAGITTGSGNVIIGAGITGLTAGLTNNFLLGVGFNLASGIMRMDGPGQNLFWGCPAGNMTALGTGNTGIGTYALFHLTTGTNNNAFGGGALSNLTTGQANVGIAGGNNLTDGQFNIAIGQGSLTTTLHGANNVAIGAYALGSLGDTGANSDLTAVGNHAGTNLTQADGCTAIGSYALGNGIGPALRCVAVGLQAGYKNTTGNDNVFVGVTAGWNMTTGGTNVGIGTGALYAAIDTVGNVAVGNGALSNTQHSNACIAIGRSALAALSATPGYDGNVAIGDQAAAISTSVWDTVAIGASAGYANNGGQNVIIGGSAMFTPGGSTASQCVVVGNAAGNHITSGAYNVAIGARVLQDLTSGQLNTGLGTATGAGLTTGNGNTILGANVNGLTGALSNSVILATGGGTAADIRLDFGLTTVGQWTSKYPLVFPMGAVTAYNPPLQITQTWNNAASGYGAIYIAITPTAYAQSNVILVNMGTDDNGVRSFTALGAAGAERVVMSAGGNIYSSTYYAKDPSSGNVVAACTSDASSAGSGVWLNSNSVVRWDSTANVGSGTPDTVIRRETSAGIVALRYGSQSHCLRVYKTYVDASNYGRAFFDFQQVSGDLTVGTESAGSVGPSSLRFKVANVECWYIAAANGALAPITTGSFEFGQSGQRVQNIWLANALIVGTNNFTMSPSGGNATNPNVLISNYNGNDMGLVMIGGSTSSYPALKRSSAVLQARLADDTNYADFSAARFGAGKAPSHSLDIIAGTASVAPIRLTSGTNLTTAAAGCVEFDGTSYYATAVASARQVVDTEQIQVLSATRTFTNNTSAQAIFNATANGAVTVQASTTYEFECIVCATGFSSSAHTIAFGLAGTAGYTSIHYYYETSTQSSPLATPTAGTQGWVNTNAATAITASVTTTGLTAYIRGTMRISATGGTVIPQLTQQTASAAAIVEINSFFRCWPIGSNVVTNVGNWS